MNHAYLVHCQGEAIQVHLSCLRLILLIRIESPEPPSFSFEVSFEPPLHAASISMMAIRRASTENLDFFKKYSPSSLIFLRIFPLKGLSLYHLLIVGIVHSEYQRGKLEAFIAGIHQKKLANRLHKSVNLLKKPINAVY